MIQNHISWVTVVHYFGREFLSNLRFTISSTCSFYVLHVRLYKTFFFFFLYFTEDDESVEAEQDVDAASEEAGGEEEEVGFGRNSIPASNVDVSSA